MMRKFQTLRALGPRRLFRLSRGYRLGWLGAIRGYFTTRTLQALLNTGFLDALAEQKCVPAGRFAADHDLDPQVLETLCNSLYAMRILNRSPAGYSLTARGRALVEVGRGWFMGVYGYEPVYHHLEDLLRGQRRYGRDLNRRPLPAARGSCAMADWVHFPVAVQRIRALGARRVLDLGCGDGTLLRRLCTEIQDAEGYGVDNDPQVLEEARTTTAESGLEGRIHLAAADLTQPEAFPPAFLQVDAAVSVLVLHELLWDGPDRVVAGLRRFRAALPGVPLLIVEAIRPSDEAMRRRPGMMVQYVVQHDLSHQRLLSRTEWRNVFSAAGYAPPTEEYFDFARMALYLLR